MGEYDVTLCTDKNAYKLLNWKTEKKLEDYINEWLGENK